MTAKLTGTPRRGILLASEPTVSKHGGVMMKQQFTRMALLAAAAWIVNSAAFAQQSGTTRGSQTGQTTQGTTETRPATQSGSAQRSTTTGQLAAADQAFLKEAATGGLMEVELGRLATEKASSPEVKQFGQRMVDDHGKANQQLSTMAQQKNVQIATELTGKAKGDYDRLSKLSGEQFDRAYMQMMVRDHRKDVSDFRKQSTSAKDTDLKSFASQTLPTLEEHLKMAEQTQSSLSAARATSGKTSGTEQKGTSGAPQQPQK
jgi:putative membrane protein